MDIGGSYLWFSGFTVAPSSGIGVWIRSTCDYIILDTLNFPNAVTAAAPVYGDCAVLIGAGSSRITVKSCTLHTSSVSKGDDGHGNIAASIYFEAAGNSFGGHVLADNVVTGMFRDGFGGGGNYYGDGPVANSDICRNILSGMQDDGIECEGDNVNVRIWGNMITNVTGQSGLGVAGTDIGPLYVFRNLFYVSNAPPAGVKLGNVSPGPVYFFHNTIVARSYPNDVIADIGGETKSDLHTFLNNIFDSSAGRYAVYRGGRTNTYDYNLYNGNSPGLFDEYNGTGHYQTLVAFRTATSQEQHGVQGSPAFSNGNFRISAVSPAVDKGVILPNFNDQNSAWPFQGSAPDIGHWELPPTSPSPPSNLRVLR